jgi:hypothetical protein
LAIVLAPVLAVSARAETFLVVGYQANVREGPGRSSRVLVTLDRGALLDVSGRVGRWYRVRVLPSGPDGYVHDSLVRKHRAAALPIPQPVPAPDEPVPGAPLPAEPRPAARPPAPRPQPAPGDFGRPPVPYPAAPTAVQEDGLEPPTLALTLEGGYQDLTQARRSAAAVFDGSRGGAAFGGSLRLTVRGGAFVGVGARYFRKEGQRVFLTDPEGPIAFLGHPLQVRLIPVYGMLGYRFTTGRRLFPYLAVGGGVTLFRERSTIGSETETVTSSKATGLAAGGVDFVAGRLTLGLEASWSTVPDSLGVGGVSAIYGEDDIGGFAMVFKVGYAR